MLRATSIATGVAAALLSVYLTGNLSLSLRSLFNDAERYSCRPFLPTVLSDALSLHEGPISQAPASLDDYFSTHPARALIDSLSVAVVTSRDTIYEQNFGVTRGNESGSAPTNSHSMYRIASVAKLFAVLEGHILQQKGIISWDDPIDKYIPGFVYNPSGVNRASPMFAVDTPLMTLRALASHTSGLGRDWPPGTVANWPHDLAGMGPPPTNGLPFPSYDALLAAIARYPLVSPPGYSPAYSNTGTALLGYALAVAKSAAEGAAQKISYPEMLQRDVFGPMLLNDSHFLATPENRHRIVVPSLAPEVADQDFLDAMNPAAGQFSSLADLVAVTQTLLDASHLRSQLTAHTLRTWLRPTHTFAEDDWTATGLMWEIIKLRDSHGRPQNVFWKLGAMAGYHAALAVHPSAGYGVVVLLAGRFPDAARIAYDVFERVEPAADAARADAARALFAGTWREGENATSEVRIEVWRGTLYVERMMLEGVDALKQFGAAGPLALRSSGRRDEFRVDTGIPGYNGLKHMGCYPYWNGQDLWGVRNNAAVNAIYFTGSLPLHGGRDERRLHVPSLSLVLERV
ncbi:beta-lactamase/transpeptidase-like protein [Epithele typhae]|uniref:beta-lactamase/transpeptidase-like protein n=1 Tax=Epithele typhae TaxID=378194 RepID=UPI0020083BE3|nr:beta-lactamase/transpeptidase-like protein [Epithele typhae]KAH9940097.1 beta-lactamase/transpeptidase-like protein [Epithele typhae]